MRPRLEETNFDLALSAVELAVKRGIKPAARELCLARNTVRDLMWRQDLMWVVRKAARQRDAWGKLNRCLGLPVESRDADAMWWAYAKGWCLPEVGVVWGDLFGVPVDAGTLRNFRRRNPMAFKLIRKEKAAKFRKMKRGKRADKITKT
jgi:hypothetical protein